MPWFVVDDHLAMHPKVVEAGNAAMGLWVRAGSWCAAHLTDGSLPSAMLAPLGGRSRDAKRLVDAGLWSQPDGRGGAYQFNDWDKYQFSKAQVEAKRERDRERKRRPKGEEIPRGIEADSDKESQRIHATPNLSLPIPNLEEIEDTPKAALLGQRFDDFWQAYPRRVGKRDARRKWDLIFKEDPTVDPQSIIDAATRFANDPNRADKFTKHPSTWLHQGNWEDKESLFSGGSKGKAPIDWENV